MFSLDEVIYFHDTAIDRYGGSKGLRDFGALDSALNRPWQTFGGKELYPDCFSKAGAILESVILNHPFIDGNKRTAFFLCEALLESSGFTISAETAIIYDFIISISTGEISIDSIVTRLKQNTQQSA